MVTGLVLYLLRLKLHILPIPTHQQKPYGHKVITKRHNLAQESNQKRQQ